MTDLEVAFDRIARRGAEPDADAVVDAALDSVAPAKRAPRRRVLRAMLTAAAALVIATTAVATYVRNRVDDIDRVNVAGALSDVEPTAAEPMTVLIVGVDRPVAGARDSGVPDVGRADVIVLARFDPTRHTVALLSIPRDIRVRVPGTDRDDRLNTVFAEGPTQLIDVVAGVTGIRPDHYVELDFNAFARIVDAVGGVALQFGAPMRDQLSGLDVDAGCQTLGGETALAFVRARHVEIREPDGHYSADPTGDIGRIQRQGQLINAAIANFPRTVGKNPVRLNRLLGALSDAVTLDSSLSTRDLLSQLRAFVNHPPARSFLVVPTTSIVINGAALLEIDTTQLPDALAAFAEPATGEQPSHGSACQP